MTHTAERKDPIGEHVISTMSRQDAAEHLRDLLRSLAPSEAQVVAARFMGIPGTILAESFDTSVRLIDKVEQRAIVELVSQPTLFTNVDALFSLKNFVED